jgi:hypothetical protein
LWVGVRLLTGRNVVLGVVDVVDGVEVVDVVDGVDVVDVVDGVDVVDLVEGVDLGVSSSAMKSLPGI